MIANGSQDPRKTRFFKLRALTLVLLRCCLVHLLAFVVLHSTPRTRTTVPDTLAPEPREVLITHSESSDTVTIDKKVLDVPELNETTSSRIPLLDRVKCGTPLISASV